ncbi:hypothetical protein K505DRAFT_346036 [Melanomma pulvis-pyrius CBS 109.77]|uniref:C3H1-type domain-containing protein n=1 Tax=Melanomma pulvis-pyrius CBS 109.77 TaxID=1314802 RepID=A0A6A6XSH2_9PLEO|nr:hypothetical protein K505DRAFT_346036 [Melanomma pulvis-pyrius CBS 109.77]
MPGTQNRRTGVCHQFSDFGCCTYGDSCKFRHVSSKRVGQSQSFRKYPEFNYCKGEPIVQEFYRMCDYFEWEKEDIEKKTAHEDFKTAMVLTFNSLYGTDVDDIDSWHKLCVALDIDPLPEGLKECQRAVQKVHVNIVDLVDTRGEQVEIFDSLEDLQDYTIETGKFFPKQSAYAGGVLKALLREILGERRSGYRR